MPAGRSCEPAHEPRLGHVLDTQPKIGRPIGAGDVAAHPVRALPKLKSPR